MMDGIITREQFCILANCYVDQSVSQEGKIIKPWPAKKITRKSKDLSNPCVERFLEDEKKVSQVVEIANIFLNHIEIHK